MVVAVCGAGCASSQRGQEVSRYAEMCGKEAPAFSLPDLDGLPVRLQDFRGKPVMVCFWAVGCPPCREEAKHLSRLSQRYRKDGLVVLGVNAWDESRSTVKEFVTKEKLTHRMLLDGGKVFSRYEGEGVPMVVWIDRAGNIADVEVGFSGPAPLDRKTRALVE